MTYKKTYNPCDECNYSYSNNNQESNMCKICEFKELVERDYSKDYLTGMKHLADAILYELNRLEAHYSEKTKTAQSLKHELYYASIGDGMIKAKDIVKETLNMQLSVKGGEQE